MKRNIRSIINADKINMDGLVVDQPLPNQDLEYLDPFLLIHHANQLYRGDRKPQEAGVGPHPHRGFSPVTFVIQGEVHHRDSRGNDAVVSAGGMQWMNAGMGIIHSERPTMQMARDGGRMEIIQVWVNSPEKNKMDQPYYLPIHEGTLTKIERDQGKVMVRLYSGKLEEYSGPAAVQSPVTMMRIDFNGDGKYNYESVTGENVLVYVLNGSILVNNEEVGRKQLVAFEQGAGQITFSAREDTQLVLLSGKPLHEPVVKYGPYVMNTQTQIMEAMRDYKMGKMGILIEEFGS